MLEESLQQELRLLEYPPKPWVTPCINGVYDVVIVGAGMAGLAAGFGLFKEGISNILLLDESPEGFEGPWDTYARMLTLRSGKNLAGPALGIPSLTFQAWYTEQFGKEAWEALYKIPTQQWMQYLRWYKRVLHLPVQNGIKVEQLVPNGCMIDLQLAQGKKITAKKVVLATGRSGFGGTIAPHFLTALPNLSFAHTCTAFDFTKLAGKDIAIVGVGSSAFDAAACALDSQAKSVTMLLRGKKIPQVNKALSLVYPGFFEGLYQLSDQERWMFMYAVHQTIAPPPHESLNRVKEYKNLFVEPSCQINGASWNNQHIELETSQGVKNFDFLIIATGFEIDGSKQPELKTIYPDIRLWGDVALEKPASYPAEFDRYPYLGAHFQFMPKSPNQASYLQHIYCFNFAAIMSHGLVSGDIPGISIGPERLAKGIAADFLKNDSTHYLEALRAFAVHEFEEENYPFLKPKNVTG